MPRIPRFHGLMVAVMLITVIAIWAFWWRNVVSLRVEIPRNDAARVFVSVEARYRDGTRYEERQVFSGYVLANTPNTFRLPGAWPWRFDSLRVHVFHPGLLWFDTEEPSNPHWSRAFVTVSPPVLRERLEGDSLSVSEVERHFSQLDELYVGKLGVRQAAEQAWPYLDRLRLLTMAAGFRKEPGAQLDAAGKAEQLMQLQRQWARLEAQLRLAEYLPCEKSSVAFLNEVPGVSPGCGQRSMLSVR